MTKLGGHLRNIAIRAWRSIRSLFVKTKGPVATLADWIQIIGGIFLLGGIIAAAIWPKADDGPIPPPEPPIRIPPSPPPPSPPPPPPPRTVCTADEEIEAFGVMRASIESDVGRYMRFPGQPQVMHRRCRLSGQRYEIVFKMDVPGTLCDDRLRYEAYYTGGWPVDGTRVRLERVGPEFAILLRQKRELRENPGMFPTCPR